jgi:anti-sigma regulatory factor (Ser/Thr protein kinase)
MSSAGDPDIVTTTRFPAQLSAVPAPREQRHARHPWRHIDDQGATTLPLAGQPGHGRTASLRRQPGRIVDGRMEGGPASAFELICPSCGDHRYLDYSAAYMAFQPGRLDRLRAFVAQHAWRAGLDQESGSAIVRAVNEIATSSIQHGGGHGELRAWIESRSLVCDVSDHGHITSPLAGRLPPALAAAPGTALWLANQLCDLVQIYSHPGGTAIRLYQNA